MASIVIGGVREKCMRFVLGSKKPVDSHDIAAAVKHPLHQVQSAVWLLNKDGLFKKVGTHPEHKLRALYVAAPSAKQLNKRHKLFLTKKTASSQGARSRALEVNSGEEEMEALLASMRAMHRAVEVHFKRYQRLRERVKKQADGMQNLAR